ncbi:glycosyltransferase domain protein [Bacteroides fragilis str. S24L15]|nr:glycosyltransferase domain protein [Bacteroides fragilis str. S24L15]EYA76429.1 glycosyltransferase domain protein [Bacteroides fragilis str. S24L26]EYA80847.1 glycosyltransferase domain protein [Bacteroides fragilis str. S24L34]
MFQGKLQLILFRKKLSDEIKVGLFIMALILFALEGMKIKD